jgi:H/ACA ribonucleoprotein complex subunit 4
MLTYLPTAGTYIRTLCVHLGLILGVGAHMQELRRIRSGIMDERSNMVTLHDVKDAVHQYNATQDETLLRHVVMPLESILVGYKRILVKDSAVAAVAYGANLNRSGVLRLDKGIKLNEEIVLITTKGEAIAIAIARMDLKTIVTTDHGEVAKTKRVIMDRDLYRKQWGKGPKAREKSALKAQGKLDKYGHPNEKTDPEWAKNYVYYDRPSAPTAAGLEITSEAPPALPASTTVGAVASPKSDTKRKASDGVDDGADAKRHKAEETPEERKLRKEAKKAKKAEKLAKAASAASG